jgi:glutamate N-acetyltransferase/amino-acid N-acetyltransferase
MARLAARQIGAEPREMLVASTGIIGKRLPMEKIRAGIDAVGPSLGTDADQAVARAILTTDTRPKTARRSVTIDGEEVCLAGIAKGAGMIAPSMATMISVITTDVAIAPRDLRRLLRRAGEATFNAVTVDSDTSTSDTLAVLASGAAPVRVGPSGASMEAFAEALTGLCDELARSLVADGEGATRVIEIAVTGARSDAEARVAARSVADSPLVKTAVHGQDPNWGRIVMALGKSPAKVQADRLTVRIAGTTVFAGGVGQAFDANALSARLGEATVRIEADLGLGTGAFTALTCDLSREYITINADYHT